MLRRREKKEERMRSRRRKHVGNHPKANMGYMRKREGRLRERR